MEEQTESKQLESMVDVKAPPTDAAVITSTVHDEKDDDEDDEEEEEDKIVEKSYNNRFHKRNKRLPTQIGGVDNTFIAIEPKSGKEVMWNERMLPEKKTERDNRFLTIVKKLKKQAHPFLIRFLDAWITKSDSGPRKLVFVNERLDDGTLKQFLCNSTSRSKLLWRRHIGQLLSVLMYLHRLGVTHGNLKKEAIYYQSSGNLKVGPFMLDAFFDQKSPATDIYAFGVLALEIAVWTQTIDTQVSSEEEKVKVMLASLTDPQQRSFIEACCDPNPSNRPKIKALLNHPAVAEVPTLKLLSAKVLVTSMKSLPPDDTAPGAGGVGPGGAAESGSGVGAGVGGAKAEAPTDFAELLRDYISHLEDETVILDVAFLTDQVTKTRYWKDYRSNFTLTSKYLEDVKNGFYPFLGYHFGAVAAEQEEEEEGSAGPAGVVSTTAVDGAGNGGQPLMATASSGMISNAASSTTSRKHSASVISTTDTPPRHLSATHEFPTEGTKFDNFSDFSLTASAAVAAAAAAAASLVVSARFESVPGDPEMRRRSLPNSLAERLISASQLKEYVQTMLTGVGMTAAPVANADAVARTTGGTATTAVLNAPNSAIQQPYALLQQTATNVREKRILQQSACVAGTEEVCPLGSAVRGMNASTTRPPVQNVPHTPHTSIASTLTQSAAVSLASAVNAVPPQPSTTNPTAAVSTAAASSANAAGMNVAEDEEGDAEISEDDDDQNDSDDDDDDDEDDEESGAKGGVQGTEKGCDGAPQVVHVPPPTQSPTTAALFTHCQYAYIGVGRWQVYVQMWFVEDRLKREAYLQVLEHEWHDYDRIADLFEGSKCLSSSDKSILVRLLAMARHNIPLVEGELIYPCYAPQCNSNIYAQELYSKLVTLHLHQQAQELIARASLNGTAHVIPTANANASSQQQAETPVALQSANQADPNNATAPAAASVAELVDANPAAAAVPVLLPSGAMTTASDPCRSSLPPSQQGPGSCPHELADRAEASEAPIRVNGNLQVLPPPPSVRQPVATEGGGAGGAGVPAMVVASSNSVQTSDPNPPQLAPANPLTRLNNQDIVEMLDVGALAPQNATCALCDRHDYLHHVDLPNYLTCPCYHCRESLARDAKITPEDLFNLHLQHNVPWPAFLQARFNIPPDGRSLNELIAYDCRWRGREPCTCLPDSGPLPPCVEFPWFYTDPSATCTTATNASPQPSPDTTYHSSDASLNSVPPVATANVTDAKTGDGHPTVTTAPQMAVQQPKAPQLDNITSSKHSHSSALPCASRHARGSLGPPQCCDPTGRFKDVTRPEAAGHQHTPQSNRSSSEPQPPAVEGQKFLSDWPGGPEPDFAPIENILLASHSVRGHFGHPFMARKGQKQSGYYAKWEEAQHKRLNRK
ncbi:nuclear receptor binding protein [Echinococcus multilocularis]|uniref:Nuclear receptor binding protein n=1 Tax=Echinococcus multilocularis TaxID=6211 RepID=A0A068Y892_ECHMU|nr:nuclear receptor binding protein [Echinococcus multilocularis]